MYIDPIEVKQVLRELVIHYCLSNLGGKTFGEWVIGEAYQNLEGTDKKDKLTLISNVQNPIIAASYLETFIIQKLLDLYPARNMADMLYRDLTATE